MIPLQFFLFSGCVHDSKMRVLHFISYIPAIENETSNLLIIYIDTSINFLTKDYQHLKHCNKITINDIIYCYFPVFDNVVARIVVFYRLLQIDYACTPSTLLCGIVSTAQGVLRMHAKDSVWHRPLHDIWRLQQQANPWSMQGTSPMPIRDIVHHEQPIWRHVVRGARFAHSKMQGPASVQR